MIVTGLELMHKKGMTETPIMYFELELDKHQKEFMFSVKPFIDANACQ